MKVTLQVNGQERQKPTEGVWFEVYPQDIDQTLFAESRADKKQEKTRKLILEAFVELKNNPKKYGKNFKTMMPVKTWAGESVEGLKKRACELGDHIADWVEQALEWAQRITNGESWETICNDTDTANWFRLVIWKDGYARLVGGSRRGSYVPPASEVDSYGYNSHDSINYTVPLVVHYKK